MESIRKLGELFQTIVPSSTTNPPFSENLVHFTECTYIAQTISPTGTTSTEIKAVPNIIEYNSINNPTTSFYSSILTPLDLHLIPTKSPRMSVKSPGMRYTLQHRIPQQYDNHVMEQMENATTHPITHYSQ